MQLTILNSKVKDESPDTQPTPNTTVTVSFIISKLFSDTNLKQNSCDINISYSDFEKNPDPGTSLHDFILSALIDRINTGNLIFSWVDFDYVMSGNTINSVKVYFTTYDRDKDNKIKIDDSFAIPYADYQTKMANGIIDVMNGIKTEFLTELGYKPQQ